MEEWAKKLDKWITKRCFYGAAVAEKISELVGEQSSFKRQSPPEQKKKSIKEDKIRPGLDRNPP